MEGLSCQSCRGITSEFTILSCDHVVCAECLWGEVRTSLQGVNTIRCSCGALTSFPKSRLSSPKLADSTPRMLSTRKLKTESATFSVRTPSSPESIRETHVHKHEKRSQLQSELQFLGVQFKKSLEEIERNFRRVVDSLTNRYTNLVKNIRLFWLQQVAQNQLLTILQFPKLLLRKYQKSVGAGIQRINENFLQYLSSSRAETQMGERINHSCKHYCQNKENKENRLRQIQQRQRLIHAIEDLKEGRGGGIKKIGKKSRPLFPRV